MESDVITVIKIKRTAPRGESLMLFIDSQKDRNGIMVLPYGIPDNIAERIGPSMLIVKSYEELAEVIEDRNPDSVFIDLPDPSDNWSFVFDCSVRTIILAVAEMR